MFSRFHTRRTQSPTALIREHGFADSVFALAEEFSTRRDSQLSALLNVIRREVLTGVDIREPRIVKPVFALVFEAIRRTIGLKLYAVQLQAGYVLSHGMIAEMRTGEGKTIVVPLPAVLHGLRQRGVHVATVNSYLTERDFNLLAPAYEMLGVSAGLLRDGAEPSSKRQAYACDVTYGTGYEFGFDYLRDQLQQIQVGRRQLGQALLQRLQGTTHPENMRLQNRYGFAVIDEADSVLLDEANTPLVISQVGRESTNADPLLNEAKRIASLLRPDVHFRLRPRERTICLLNAAHTAIFHGSEPVPTVGLQRPWTTYIENALRAHHILKRDVDYVIRDNKVLLVDPHTGRIFNDRSWQNGLHQAVECEAQVPITSERNSNARVSRQRYFRLYEQLCGMTGTARGHESEFKEFYNLQLFVIPERIPSQRHDLPTLYFPNEAAKLSAIVRDVQRRHAVGQPILIGTSTIDESERLAVLFRSHELSHRVLNGKQDDSEADLVAQAGQARAITIATNMAGRGTDIALSDESRVAGGLHVIATQRQESRRLDRQLMGRAGRQGEVGSSQFFVSSEDHLLSRFAPQFARTLSLLKNPDGISSEKFDRQIMEIQKRSEAHAYRTRRELWHHDQWMNRILVAVAKRDQNPVASSAMGKAGGSRV